MGSGIFLILVYRRKHILNEIITAIDFNIDQVDYYDYNALDKYRWPPQDVDNQKRYQHVRR
jgi:hypothetical protein